MKHTNYVAIDISDSSVKILQLDSENTIVAYGSEAIPAGVVVEGQIVDITVFSEILNRVMSTTRPEVLSTDDEMLRAIVCLPESKIFTHYVQIPDTVHHNELKAYIVEDARKTIPFDLGEMYWDYHVVTKDGKLGATFLSAQKKDLDNYVETLTRAKVRPAFVGSELFSLGRALLPTSLGGESYMIIDIGGRSTTIGIFSDDAIANMSVRVPLAGQYFTKKIMDALHVSQEEAQSMKSMYGVNPEHDATGVPPVLRACIQEIAVEINEAKTYFEKKTGNVIQHVILAGGSSLMDHIDTYMQEVIGIETKQADPLNKIKNAEVFGKETPGLLFSTVIGLALLGSNMSLPHINLLTQYQYKDNHMKARFTRMRDIRSKEDIQFVLKRFMHRVRKYAEGRKFFAGNMPRINPRTLFILIFFMFSIGFLGWVIIKYAL